MTKFDVLLREKLGGDPPGDLHGVIIEYYAIPTEINVQTVQQTGINITGISGTTPFIYAQGTREALLDLERDPNVKKIYSSEQVSVM